MAKIKYKTINIGNDRLNIIEEANTLINQYRAQGYLLTLRQLYYRFVAEDLFPESWRDQKTGSKNVQKNYKNLGDIINDGRLAGLIDWEAIEDRTRELGGNSHWTSPASIIEICARQYQIDKWESQKYRVEVWVEKDALEGIVSKAATQLDVDYFSCRGYTSQTAMWAAGQRLKRYARYDQCPVILHLGDHDPSGLDMSRDIEDRLRMFIGNYGGELIFKRIALNPDQIEQYSPPPSPAKITDSRCAKYIEIYGEDSWELDALEPVVLSDLIQHEIFQYRDIKKFARLQKREDTEKEFLQQVADRWEDIVKQLRR